MNSITFLETTHIPQGSLYYS